MIGAIRGDFRENARLWIVQSAVYFERSQAVQYLKLGSHALLQGLDLELEHFKGDRASRIGLRLVDL